MPSPPPYSFARPRPAWRWVALAALLAAPAVQAQSGALARPLFEEGRRAMKEGRFDIACPKLEESQRLDPGVGTLLNLALCEEARGRVATAAAHFRDLLETAPSGDARVPVARKHLTALAPRVPRLTLRTRREGLDDGERIWLDGVPLGLASVGVALQVDPGMHELRAGAEGRELRQTFSLAEGEQGERWLEDGQPVNPPPAPAAPAAPSAPVSLAPAPPAPVTVVLPPAPPPPGRLPLVLVGLGSLGLTVAATAGIVALHERQIVRQQCPTASQCTDEGLAAAGRGRRAFLVSDIALIAGVVGLGSGVGLMLLPGPRSNVVAVGGTW